MANQVTHGNNSSVLNEVLKRKTKQDNKLRKDSVKMNGGIAGYIY